MKETLAHRARILDGIERRPVPHHLRSLEAQEERRGSGSPLRIHIQDQTRGYDLQSGCRKETTTAPERFTVTVYNAGDGPLWAELAELPGCVVCGDSLNELGDGLLRTINAELPHPDAAANLRITNWSQIGAPDSYAPQASTSEWMVELSLHEQEELGAAGDHLTCDRRTRQRVERRTWT